MAYTLANLKNDVERKIHGTTIDKITGFYDLAFEAARNVLANIDPRETKRIANIENALYDQVYSYTAPTDLKGDAIIDIRPQVNRSEADNFSRSYSEDFDMRKTNLTFAIEDNSNVKTIRIAKSLHSGATLHTLNSLTDNGTWAAGGNATDLAVDTLNYVSGSASLKFNISSSGSTAYIENSTFTAVDLSSYVDVGALFVWVYIPSTSIITSITLRWGSDSSNYYSRSATTRHDATSFVVGWNLLRFDWSGATETGTVTDSAIDYLRVTFNYSGTATSGCRVDNIVARLGSVYEIVYYSNYLFRNSSGTWIETPTADTDIVNLSTESYNILLYELVYLVAQELQGEDANFDEESFTKKRDNMWKAYKETYKSERIKPRAFYYRPYNQRRR